MPWTITYEIVTEESAEHGAAEESGFYSEGLSLRGAIDELKFLGLLGAYCEADSCPISLDFPPRWFTYAEGIENYETGARTHYSIHIPDHITPASRMRLARFLACYGIQETRQ